MQPGSKIDSITGGSWRVHLIPVPAMEWPGNEVSTLAVQMMISHAPWSSVLHSTEMVA